MYHRDHKYRATQKKMKNTTVWLLCESVLVAVDGFTDRKKVLALKQNEDKTI